MGKVHPYRSAGPLSPVVSENYVMVGRGTVRFCTLAAALLLSSIAEAQDTLVWKLSSGETLKYGVKQKTQMEIQLNGQSQAVVMDQNMDMVWKVQSVAGNGDAKMTQTVDRVQFASEGGPFGKAQFDSASNETSDSPLVKAMAAVFRKIIGREFGVTMQATGKIQDVVVPETLLTDLTEAGATGTVMNADTLKQIMTQSAVTLPGRAVNPGDSWDSSQKVELPIGVMTVSSTMTYTGIENGMAKISMQPKVEVKPKEGAPITMTMNKSEGSGTVLFDVARGRIARSDLELRMELSVRQGGIPIQQSLRQSTAMVLIE